MRNLQYVLLCMQMTLTKKIKKIHYINENYIDNKVKSNWFIKNKPTYGNPSYEKIK